jgi:hypothetical protein
VPLRIAFDLDGVFADMEGELARHAEALFGTRSEASQRVEDDQASGQIEGASTKSDEPPLSRLAVTQRQQRRLWDHVEGINNFWETLKEIEPGSLTKLARLATQRRWEVIFLTRRPATAGATAQLQSQRWLKARGFPLPSVFVVQGSRGRVAASLALDFVIDDTPENCLDVVVDSKARAVLVWRNDSQPPSATTTRLGIGVVKSVDECLDILAQLDSRSSDTAGMMDRVMRLFGFKEATGT